MWSGGAWNLLITLPCKAGSNLLSHLRTHETKQLSFRILTFEFTFSDLPEDRWKKLRDVCIRFFLLKGAITQKKLRKILSKKEQFIAYNKKWNAVYVLEKSNHLFINSKIDVTVDFLYYQHHYSLMLHVWRHWYYILVSFTSLFLDWASAIVGLRLFI